MWLLSQYSSQHCDVYTYILALVESFSTSFTNNRQCPYSGPILFLFQVHNYIPLAHNLNIQVQNLCNPRSIKYEQDVIAELGRLPGTLKEAFDIIYQIISELGPTSRIAAEKVFHMASMC